MPYQYFFSYARRDSDDDIDKFFKDLRRSVQLHSGHKSHEDIAFRDVEIQVGNRWATKVQDALRTSRILICMVSPNYLNSEFCGKEFQVFLERQKSDGSLVNKPEHRSSIFPVIWIRPRSSLPSCLTSLQLYDSSFPPTYSTHGLRSLIVHKSPEYATFLEAFATKLVDAMESLPTSTIPELPPFEQVRNAFEESAQDDTRFNVCRGGDASSTGIFLSTVEPTPIFVGREKIFGELLSSICTHESRRIAIWGRPGIGKTQLALRLAQRAKTHFPGGIFVGDLKLNRREQPSRVSENLVVWGRVLGVMSANQTSVTDDFIKEELRLIWAKDQQARLFILNDAPTLAEATHFLLDSCSKSTYLLSTHDRDDAVQFAGSDQVFALEDFSEEEALEVLEFHASIRFSADRDNALALVNHLGRDPLALSLLGKWLGREYSAGNMPKLTDIRQGLPASDFSRQVADIVLMIERSLDADANDALHALSALPGRPSTFSAEAAKFILTSNSHSLQRLVNFGLLQTMPEHRYAFGQSLNHYFYHHHSDEEEPKRRVVEYFAKFLSGRTNDYQSLEPERHNIEQSIILAQQMKQHRIAVNVALDFSDFLRVHGPYEKATQILSRARSSASEMNDPSVEARVLERLGAISYRFGYYLEGHELFLKGLELISTLPPAQSFKDVKADLLLGLAILKDRYGDNAGAERSLKEAIEVLIADPARHCSFQETLGWVYAHRGEYGAAKREWLQGVERATTRQFPDWRKAKCWLNADLGWVEDRQGNITKAEEYLNVAEEEADRLIPDHQPWCTVMINRGAAAIHRAKYASAEGYLRKALAIARRHVIDSVNILLENLAIVALRKGDEAEAEDLLSEGLAAATSVGDPERISAFLSYLGELAMGLGNLRGAEHYLVTGLALARRAGNPERLVANLLNLGLVNVKRKRLTEAERYLQEALPAVTSTGYQCQLAAVHIARGTLFFEKNEAARAKAEFESAKRIAERIESDDNLAASLFGLSTVATSPGERNEFLERSELTKRRIGYRSLGHKEKKATGSSGV